MSEDRYDDRLEELRRRAILEEFTFTSTATVIGGLVARLRDVWNSVATKWQVRPIIAQQFAFNQALVDWLARPPGAGAFDVRLIDHDREQTRLAGDLGLLAARTRWVIHQATGPGDRRLRLAYFSPLPPARSGIADYSAELLPYLAHCTRWATASITGLSTIGCYAFPASSSCTRFTYITSCGITPWDAATG
jgi:hypothetical protein